MIHEAVPKIAGIPLDELVEPVQEALRTYSEATDGKVKFDAELAGRLELTPDKPNSARSATTVMHLGKEAATLYVIAFAPEDGTGSYGTYGAATLNTGVYPSLPRYYPRSKAGTDSEAHLTLVTRKFGPESEPVLFAGHLSVLGLVGDRQIVRVGYVGQELDAYEAAIKQTGPARPTVTLTTGYRGGISLTTSSTGERFGDPHAIVNRSLNTVQVCGFIAMDDTATFQQRDALRLLGAVEPRWG